MIKRGVSIGLIIILIAQVVSNFSYVLDYHFNLEKYQASCINKNRPELNCNGSCSVSKQISLGDLDPISGPEKSGKQDKKNKLELNLFFNNQLVHSFVNYTTPNYRLNSILILTAPFNSDIFHPPQLLS